MKCKKHSNKDVILVCIDCLDVLCIICVKSSKHLDAKHHVEEVDKAAHELQKKFKKSQRSHEKKWLKLEELHCFSTGNAQRGKEITLLANKLHSEINKSQGQLAMVLEMNFFLKNQESKIRSKLDILDNDIETLLRKIQQTQCLGKEDDEGFMNKLQQEIAGPAKDKDPRRM